MPFTTSARVTEVDATGIDISAAGIVTIHGDVTFKLQPSGRVDVTIPNASLTISVPINGTVTPVFGISGVAAFSFGGGLGFQLQRLSVNGFSIFDYNFDVALPPPVTPPTVELAAPFDGQNIDVDTLNAHGYIDVVFTDYSGAGLNVGSITDNSGELVLTGAAAAGVTLNGRPTQPDATNPNLYRYTFTGTFVVPATASTSDPYNAIGVQFLAGSFADANGNANLASTEQFFLFKDPPGDPAAPPVPTVRLASPLNGATISTQTLASRPYIDVTFGGGVSGATLQNIDGNELQLSGPGAAHLSPTASSVTKLSDTTYRYYLAPGNGFTTTNMFVAGEIDVTFVALAGANPTWTVQLPNGGATLKGAAGYGSFTVTSDSPDSTSSTDAISLGPLTLQGATIGLADTSFSKGKLNLTIAIGVSSASLGFGGTGSSGVSAQLTGILGTFDVQVDLLQALQALSNPSALLSAFSVPGRFTLNIAGLSMNVPNVVTVTAAGIHVNYDPTKDQSSNAATPLPLVTVDRATVNFPLFGVGADVIPATDNGHTVPGLTVYSDGFFLGQADLIFAPSGGINFANLLVFNDLRIGVKNFGVTFDHGSVQFHGGADGTSGLVISSGGVQFLPGKAINGTISDGPDADTVAVSATFTFGSDGTFKSFQFAADQLAINLGSFLTLTASNFTIDTGADASHPMVSFASVGAKVTVGGLVISGEARNFSFYGDGSFHPGNGFGIFLSVGSADGGSFAWPSWLPIKIDAIGIQWPGDNLETDPANFVLTLSASVTGIKGIDGLEFSGSIQGIQIDVGKLLAGEFPIVGISSIGVEVKGNLFGGQLDAALIGGIIKVDAAGNAIADTDTTTPVAQRVFFAGLQGGFKMAGIGGFTIRLALSDLGPLTVFLSASLPTGIMLDPETGLTMNDFAGGVEFFHTLPSIDDPFAAARGRVRRRRRTSRSTTGSRR